MVPRSADLVRGSTDDDVADHMGWEPQRWFVTYRCDDALRMVQCIADITQRRSICGLTGA